MSLNVKNTNYDIPKFDNINYDLHIKNSKI